MKFQDFWIRILPKNFTLKVFCVASTPDPLNRVEKQRNYEEFMVDELEQHDRRRNLVFKGVSQVQNEKVIEITLSLQGNLMLI